MKTYIVLNIGEKEYRLRIPATSAIELEDKLNCSVVDGMNRLCEIRVLAKYFYAAAKQLNDDVKTEGDALAVIDEYTMQGNKVEDLYDVILSVMENSGYIKQEAIDMSKKMTAQMQEKLMEKQSALLS